MVIVFSGYALIKYHLTRLASRSEEQLETDVIIFESRDYSVILGKYFMVEGDSQLVEQYLEKLSWYGLDEGKVLGGIVLVGAQIIGVNIYLSVGVLDILVYLIVESA